MGTLLEDQAIMNLIHLASEEDEETAPPYCRSKTLHATQYTKPLHERPLSKNSSLIQRSRKANTQHKMRVESEPQSLSSTMQTSSNKENLKRILEKLSHSPRKTKPKSSTVQQIAKKARPTQRVQTRSLKSRMGRRSEPSASTLRAKISSKRRQEMMEKAIRKVACQTSGGPSRGKTANSRGLSSGVRRSREMVSYNKMLRDEREVNSWGLMGRCSPVDLKQLLF